MSPFFFYCFHISFAVALSFLHSQPQRSVGATPLSLFPPLRVFAFQGRGSFPVVPRGHPGNSPGGPGCLKACRAEHLEDTATFSLSASQPVHAATLVRPLSLYLLARDPFPLRAGAQRKAKGKKCGRSHTGHAEGTVSSS